MEQYPLSVSSVPYLPVRLPEHFITGQKSNKLSRAEHSKGWRA